MHEALVLIPSTTENQKIKGLSSGTWFRKLSCFISKFLFPWDNAALQGNSGLYKPLLDQENSHATDSTAQNGRIQRTVRQDSRDPTIKQQKPNNFGLRVNEDQR
jgi:hypothetical protein